MVAVCAFLFAGISAPVFAQTETFKVGSFTKPADTSVNYVTAAGPARTSTLTTLTLAAFNPGSGTNRLLVVGLSHRVALGATSVTYGGVALTLVPGTAAGTGVSRTQMWSLVNPSSTPANIVATWANVGAVVIGAVAFNNVDQAAPIQNATVAAATSTTPSVTVPSQTGNLTFAIVAKNSNLGASTQTSRWFDTSQATDGGGSTAIGAATVAHAWAGTTSQVWAASGVTIKRGQASVVAHGLGQVPSAVMMWTSGSTGTGFASSDWSAFGISDGTTSYSTSRSSLDGAGTSSASRRAAMKALTIVQYGQVLLAEADLTRWDATNIDLTWSTNNGSAYVIHYMAIGGVAAKVLNWKPTAGVGDKTIGGVGFQPNVVFHLGDFDAAAPPSSIPDAAFMLGVMDSDGDEWATAVVSDSGRGTSNTWRAQRTDACIEDITTGGGVQARAAWVSMEPDGFVVNYSVNTVQNNVYSLALAGLNLKAGSFTKKQEFFVQQAAKNAGAVASTTQAFPNPSTAGNLIAVTITHDTSNLLTVTDNKGNTYVRVLGPTHWGPGNVARTSTYYASNIIGGGAPITITVTLSAAANVALEVFQFEYSGLATVNPVDQSASAFNYSGSPLNSGSRTTTQANELIFGFGGTTVGGVTGGTSYTTRSNLDTQFAGDKPVSAIGSYSVDGTFAGTQYWVAHMVTFKADSNLPLTSQPLTGLDFQPAAVFLASFQDTAQTAVVPHARMGIGASDGVVEGATAIQDADNQGTSDVENFDTATKVFAKIDNAGSAIDAEADLASFDADGFTLNWTTNDTAATEMLYVAFAPMWLTEVRLIPGSFTGEKYSNRVLVQWKTGYEIDNLGFNVYRQINGVRTKVNGSLIAGSGLQAGQGVGVSSVRPYARWDEDPLAGDPSVVYWLEDVEFNGKSTWHGPITPTVGTLNEPTIDDSDELDEIGAALSRQIFFNYNDDPVAPGPRIVSSQLPPEVKAQWSLAAQAPVKISIRKQGWYRVTQPELVAAGLDASVDPRTLQLFVNGSEVAIRVNASGATFDGAASIEFYGAGIETPHTDSRTYWLQAGIQTGRRIAVDAGVASAMSAATSFSSTLRRKDRSVFIAALKNGDVENWFGPMVYEEPAVADPDDPWAPVALTVTTQKVAPGPAQLTVALQGLTSDGNRAHRVGVKVNGAEVGEVIFAGQTHTEQTFPVAGGLVEGVNTITLDARGGDADRSLVDAIRLDYPHTYQADADRLRFTVVAPASMTVGGFAGSSIRVFDITDRMAPVQLLTTTSGPNAGLSTVTVNLPGTGLRTLMAFSDETVGSPDFVRTNRPSNLHASSNAYDYVVVSHADFLTQVAPLKTLRQQQGHRAVVVDIEDVYDEFSFGEKTPQALRDFLRWARTTWTTTPRFVVLAGDATADPRDYEGLGNADFVPTKHVPMNDVDLETASDDWFVDFTGTGLPEIAIGRLSMRTTEQANQVVAKIVGYDQAGGPWTNDVLLVADQNDAHTDFEGSSNTLRALLPSGYTPQMVYSGRLGSGAAHQAITDAVNNGQLIVNYSGHGSTDIWGNSGELLTNADVAGSWTNAAKLPFVVAMNCLNGLFSSSWGDSLAEALQRAPNGGAVAVWASSSLTTARTQALVNQELFRLIFAGTYATVGEAVAAAKRVASNPDLRRSWIFFGDPAMRLSGAPQPITADRPVITAQPQSVRITPGQSATMNVAVIGAAPLSYQWYAGASGNTANWIAGATSSSFTTPALQNTATYWVRVSNRFGTAYSNAASISTPLAIETTSPWPSAAAGTSYELTLTATTTMPPYQWETSTLPSGLTLNTTTGDITGTPNAAGTFSVDVHVTDGYAAAAKRTFGLTVAKAADALINQQWHLKTPRLEAAGADVEPVWPITRGAGVVIGIVDDGVQGTHPDLAANYLPALSLGFGDQDIDPDPLTDGTCETTANCQGTAVAGLAAARGDNGVGGSGVAPLASLASIRLAAGAVDADEAAAFLHKLNGVAIENHSWHRADDGQTLVAPGPLADAALATAIERGRAGAGRIFVWAAGDGRANGDNCNFDGYANSRFGIAVGAVADTSLQASYSESCAALLVSAPSSGGTRSLTTTDLADADGRDPGDATSAFGGTAAAAPVVSGVVALMLARNPALTWRDVQHLLVRTSRQVDPSDPSWTSGVFPHSEKYGFGVVDALAAVQRATRWTTVPAEDRVRAVTRRVGVVIPDQARAGVADTIRIGTEYGGFAVEHVEVEFTAEHPRRGDLEVTLTSPAGVVSHLGTTRAADTGANFLAWRFRSVRHWGESAAGSWTLSVADRAAGSVGIFTGWTLRIYGTATRSGGGGGPIVTPALPTAPPVTSAPGAPTRVTAAVGGTAAAAARKPSSPVRKAVSAIGSSITPAASQPQQAAPAVAPVDASAAAGEFASAAAGWNPGIYGTAPQPIESIPPSARPAASPEPAEAEGTVAGGTGAVGPEPEPLPTPDAGFASEPGAPTDLVASVTGSTIVLKWRTPTSGSTPAGYIVEAGSRAGGSNLFVSRTSGTATSFTTQSAEKGPYFIRVLATNARGTSLPSNEATLVVGNGDSGPCTGAPSAPSGVRLAVSGTSIVATWDAAQFGPTSYVVEMSSGAGGNNLVVSDTGNSATTLTVGSLAPGSYVVRVRARNACGGSGSSDTVSAVVALELR